MNNRDRYNPNTTPVWLAAMPTVLGIVAVVGVIVAIIIGAHELSGELAKVTQLAGQVVCK